MKGDCQRSIATEHKNPCQTIIKVWTWCGTAHINDPILWEVPVEGEEEEGEEEKEKKTKEKEEEKKIYR